MLRAIYIGFDPREAAAFAVTRHSIERHMTPRIVPIYGLVLSRLIAAGLYTRKIEKRIGQWTAKDGTPWASTEPVYWDEVSQFTMSTEHAIARFLVPHLHRSGGWVGFTDGDMLVRGNIVRAADKLDPAKAVYVVKHNHVPQSDVKMDGQIQSAYSRKNWSSFVLFNCDHEANRSLTPDIVNMLPGRDLHRFCWLAEDEIGELGPEWNHLVGHSAANADPKVVHFTDGVPDMKGYENVPYADEWRAARDDWAMGSLSLPG